ncbi:MAG: glutamine--fructose-6-phosphate transaminase (isomerizing) [Rickettsiales bacterium]|nr:glutamine--fructose-6-phosphate transaminase (isomerizing) [Rickettsiales bacterium]
MCGIVGVIGKLNAAEPIIDALKRLEYRGYDSAGIACSNGGNLDLRRAEGKLKNLESLVSDKPIDGTTGIGHTRWATHGVPSEANAHPHATDKVAVVHNGIIENFKSLKQSLAKSGYDFKSQTDTEVIPALITQHLNDGLKPLQAVQKTLQVLEGAFALGIIFADDPDLLIAARQGSPLAIGYGDGEMFIGSDAMALAPFTSKICYLEEGDIAVLNKSSASIYNLAGEAVERTITATNLTSAAIGKGNFNHFMQKEIFEQPVVIGETLNVYAANGQIHLPEFPFKLEEIDQISIVACGTSHYAGLVARYWIESLANVPTNIDVASEFRYREPILSPNGLTIVISQSGETADTLAALKYAQSKGQSTLAVVNVEESSMAKQADAILPTRAGPEIGVASTKAFTTQLTTLAAFTLALAKSKQTLSEDRILHFCHALAEVPAKVSEILHHDEKIQTLAKRIAHAKDMLYIGRGTSFAIAHEAALKMKEISYIHAEAYAAGEMKHGPIALIDEDMPVIAIAPSDHLFEKTASNIQEAAARGAQIIAFTDEKGASALGDIIDELIKFPAVDDFVAPILYTIPAQLLAYHVALIKGTDVDQPRNLAKSVTVE